MAIKLDIAAVKTGDGIASLQEQLQRPAQPMLAAFTHRVAGRDDLRIRMDSLVAVVQPQEDRHRPCRLIRHVNQQIDPGTLVQFEEPDADFLPCRQSLQCVRLQVS